MILGNFLDFDNNEALNFTFEKLATAALDAALTVIGEAGYDITTLRLKIFDGTTVRRILQDNDIDADTTLGGGSSSDLKAASQKAVKTYVDALLSGATTPPAAFDASSASQFPSGATSTSKYRVTGAGTIFGIALQVGDVIYPTVSNPSPTTASDWYVLQGNTDQASISVLGLVMLATLAEIQNNSGAGANKVITVAQLNAWESALGRVRSFTTTLNIAVGANQITHNLGSTAAVVEAWDANDTIHYKVVRTSANVVTLTAAKARTNVTVKVLV